MTPIQYMMAAMEDIEEDEVETILIVKRTKSGQIMFNTNTGSRYDAYALSSITQAFTQADIIKAELITEG